MTVRIAPLLLTLVLAAACGNHENNAPAASNDSASTTTTASSATTASTGAESSATSTAAATSSSSPACSAITAEQLGSIVGTQFSAGQAQAAQGDMSKCQFTTADGSGSVTITIHNSDATGLYKIMPGMSTVTGNGIGEQAWWSPQVSNWMSLQDGKTVLVAFNIRNAKQEWGNAVAKQVMKSMPAATSTSK